jgi:hypothetical protein
MDAHNFFMYSKIILTNLIGGIPPLPQGLDLVRIFTRFARLTLTGQSFLRNVEVSCR